jgi:hypothetical protein
MPKKINYFSSILFCSIVCGNINLEAVPPKKLPQKTKKALKKEQFLKDPVTGSEYKEIERKVRKKTKVIVEQRNSDGTVSRWLKSVKDAKIVCLDEATAKAFEEEDFLDEIKNAAIRAIEKESVEGLRRILGVCGDPKAFIARFPKFLREARRNLGSMRSDRKFREEVTNILIEFGYSLKVD